MLSIEHLNLVVRDIEQSLKFYQAAFPHWSVRAEGENEWYGKAYHWVHFGDDYQYIAFGNQGEGANRDLAGYQVGLAHFAFRVDNLKALIERLQAAGYKISGDGSDNQYRHNIYFEDPAGFEVEFVEYLSDIPELRNS